MFRNALITALTVTALCGPMTAQSQTLPTLEMPEHHVAAKSAAPRDPGVEGIVAVAALVIIAGVLARGR